MACDLFLSGICLNAIFPSFNIFACTKMFVFAFIPNTLEWHNKIWAYSNNQKHLLFTLKILGQVTDTWIRVILGKNGWWKEMDTQVSEVKSVLSGHHFAWWNWSSNRAKASFLYCLKPLLGDHLSIVTYDLLNRDSSAVVYQCVTCGMQICGAVPMPFSAYFRNLYLLMTLVVSEWDFVFSSLKLAWTWFHSFDMNVNSLLARSSCWL